MATPPPQPSRKAIAVSSKVTAKHTNPKPTASKSKPAEVLEMHGPATVKTTTTVKPAAPKPLFLSEDEIDKLAKEVAVKANQERLKNEEAENNWKKKEQKKEKPAEIHSTNWFERVWTSRDSRPVLLLALVALIGLGACCFKGVMRYGITPLPSASGTDNAGKILPPLPFKALNTNTEVAINVSSNVAPAINTPVTPVPLPVVNMTPGSEVDAKVSVGKPTLRPSNLPIQQIGDVEVHAHIKGTNNYVVGVWNEGDKIVDADLRKLLLTQLSEVGWPKNAKPNFEETLDPPVGGTIEKTIPPKQYWKFNFRKGWSSVIPFTPTEQQGTFKQQVNNYVVGPSTPMFQNGIWTIGYWNTGDVPLPVKLVFER